MRAETGFLETQNQKVDVISKPNEIDVKVQFVSFGSL